MKGGLTMPNLIPLTGLYSIVVMDKAAYDIEVVGNMLHYNYVKGASENDFHEELDAHYTAIGFPADVSEEEAKWMVERFNSAKYTKTYKHYDGGAYCMSAIASLKTLIRSKSLDPATSFIIKSQ